MNGLGFISGDDTDGASVSVSETAVEIAACDFAGTWENPRQSARYCFEGDDRLAFLRFCADVARAFPVPETASPDDADDGS